MNEKESLAHLLDLLEEVLRRLPAPPAEAPAEVETPVPAPTSSRRSHR
jgi:hypothetical protein